MNIHQYIDTNKDSIIEDLKGLLRIPSVEGAPQPGAPFGQHVRGALDYTLELCRSLGLKAADVDGYAGYAEIEGCTGEQIGVLTHLDVVPCGECWSHPPFEAEEQDGMIWARGICDDKGPLIASIYALAALKQSGIVPKRNIRLIFGCNEETGWGCIDYYSAHVGLPEVGFSPDADYPIINTEKGIYQGSLSCSVDNCAKTCPYQITIHGGDRPNVVPALAVATVQGNIDKLSRALLQYDCRAAGISFKAEDGTLTIKAEGIPAHASTPKNGRSALFALIELLDSLALGGQTAACLSELNSKLCGRTDGSGIGLALSDEISGALTVNLGMLTLEQGELSFTVDIRYPLCANADKVRSGLKSAFPCFTLTDGHLQEPHHTPENHYLVQALSAVYERNTGTKAQCIAIGGGTYARALKTGVAFGVTRPGAPELAHNIDERMSVSDLMEDVHMFADAYEELVK